MAQKFNNDSSVCRFMGDRDLDEVIASDERELAGIGGSFEAIADRMDYLIAKSEGIFRNRDKKRADIFRRYGYDTTEIFDVPGRDEDISTPRGKISNEIHLLYNRPELIPGEKNLALVDIISTRMGFQLCPFNCGKGSSSRDYIIRNRKVNRELWINQLTSHLARAHHLLEKGNEYGISAREFYESFM